MLGKSPERPPKSGLRANEIAKMTEPTHGPHKKAQPTILSGKKFVTDLTKSDRLLELQLSLEIIRDALKGVKAAGFPNGTPQVGIGVDVIEDTSTVGSLDTLESRDIHPDTLDNPPSLLQRLGGQIVEGIEFHRL